MSLRIKIVVTLVAFSLLGALTTFYLFNRATPALQQPAYDKASQSARALDEDIGHAVVKYHDDAAAFAAAAPVTDPENWANEIAGNPLIEAMNNDIKKDPFYRVSLYVDLTGNVRAVNTQSPKGKAIITSGYYGQNFASADWFMAVQNNKFLAAKDGAPNVTVTGPVRDTNIAKVYGDDGYVLAFATPVKDPSGKLIGMWADFVSFDAVTHLLDQQAERFKAQALPHTQITLLDTKGLILADTNDETHSADAVQKANLVTDNYAPAIAAQAHPSSTILVHGTDTKPGQLVSFYRNDGIFAEPGLGWTALVRFDSEEIFASIHNAMQQIISGFGTVVLVAFVFALIFSAIAARYMAGYAVAVAEHAVEDEIVHYEQEHAGDHVAATAPDTRNLEKTAGLITQETAKLKTAADETKKQAGETANLIAEGAKTLNDAATAVKKLAARLDSGDAPFTQAGERIAQAETKAKKLKADVATLSSDTGKLQESLTALEAVARQMHLLSLNATIESARIGAEGKGFAELATQVKALSADTTKAAEALGTQINAITSASEGLTGHADMVEGTISTLQKAAAEAAKAFGDKKLISSEASRQLEQAAARQAQTEKAVSKVTDATKQLSSASDTLTTHAKKLTEELAELDA